MQSKILYLTVAVSLLLGACDKTNDELPERGPEVTTIAASLTDIEAGVATKAVSDYVVNKPTSDPTKAEIAKRTGWKFDIAILDGTTPYGPGTKSGLALDEKAEWAVPEGEVFYFPNYKKQPVNARLYPDATDSAVVKLDQSEDKKILAEDILFTDNVVVPAKKLTVTLRHSRSMIDFKLDGMSDDISTVHVIHDNDTYIPYQVGTTNEYLLILPPNSTENPILDITTKAGVNYRQSITIVGAKNGETKIEKLEQNTCYCFSLRGIPLSFSPITVVNWQTGVSIPGDYIAVTAYPTFRGTANTTVYLYYDNRLIKDGKAKLQEITFNSRGECTIKPDGRIITHILGNSTDIPGEGNKLSNPIVISGGIVLIP